jgi:NDP-mannose synthase
MLVVILAGGKGTRLRPYTYVIPKPLMPIGSYPIIETIIYRLKQSGVKDVYISCAYKAKLLQIVVDEICQKYRINPHYILDTKEGLGTVGPISQLKNNLDEDFIVINGDTLATIDYKALYTFHKRSRNALTVTLYQRNVSIDFGVVKTEKENIVDYIEKPQEAFWVSLGINVFSPHILKYIPPRKMNFPDLVLKLIEKGEKVGAYYFDGYWRDIGRHEDFDLANLERKETFKLMGLPEEDEQ